ncbi:MAG TPA: ion channel [Gammaproteobacteria bacterium]
MNDNGLFSAGNAIVVAVTLVAVTIAVVIHHEALNALYRRLPTLGRRPRRRMFLLSGAILAVHTVEIWLFAAAYWILLAPLELGGWAGKAPPDMFNLIYFSAAAYTTAGWGDVVVEGPVRILAGMESLLGLVLITWSASFTFWELKRSWDGKDRDERT